jgi:hypothetical protein
MGVFNKEIAHEHSELMIRKVSVEFRGTLYQNGLWEVSAYAWDGDDWVNVLTGSAYSMDYESWDEVVDAYVPDIRDALVEHGLVK